MKRLSGSHAGQQLLMTGLGIVGVLGAVGLFAPWLAPYDPHAIAGPALVRPSLQHLLGTNDVGQDVLSQLMYGARRSLTVAFAAAALGTVIGVSLGAWAALKGGVTDLLLMRTVDVALAMPTLPLLILVAALARPSGVVVILSIALFSWPSIARIIRSQVMSVRERGYIMAAQGFGGGTLYLVRRHLVPATGPVIAAQFVDLAATAIMLGAGLGFLGLADANTPSWGSMLNRADAYPGIYDSLAWTWWILPSGLSITLAILGFAFLGLGLEPASNPRWNRFR